MIPTAATPSVSYAYTATAIAEARLAKFEAAHESSSRRTSAFSKTLLKRCTGSARLVSRPTARAFQVSLASSPLRAEDCGTDSCHVEESGARGAIEPEGGTRCPTRRPRLATRSPTSRPHKFVSDEPGEDDAEKTKAKFKFKSRRRRERPTTSAATSSETGRSTSSREAHSDTTPSPATPRADEAPLRAFHAAVCEHDLEGVVAKLVVLLETAWVSAGRNGFEEAVDQRPGLLDVLLGSSRNEPEL